MNILYYVHHCLINQCKIHSPRSIQHFTEKRILVLSWYTAFVAVIDLSSFSTEQLSPTIKSHVNGILIAPLYKAFTKRNTTLYIDIINMASAL